MSTFNPFGKKDDAAKKADVPAADGKNDEGAESHA